MKKGKFGTLPPVTEAEFYFKVELIPKLHRIPSAGTNVDKYSYVQLLSSALFFINTMLSASAFVRPLNCPPINKFVTQL